MKHISDVERARQLKEVDEIVNRILADFVGREITPLLAAEAEGRVREALVGMIIRGDYVLPPGLVLDRVVLGDNLKIQVYFKRAIILAL